MDNFDDVLRTIVLKMSTKVISTTLIVYYLNKCTYIPISLSV